MKQSGVFLLLAAFSIPASAGVVFEMKTKIHGESEVEEYGTQLFVEGGSLRVDLPPVAGGRSNSDSALIYSGDRREIVVVNYDNNMYAVVDEQAVDSAGERGRARMNKALENLPAQSRAAFEQMVERTRADRPIARPTLELQKTDVQDSRRGYPCVKYVVSRGGQEVRRIWVTEWANIEGGEEAAKTLAGMADFLAGVLETDPSLREQQGIGESVWEHMNDLGGFPVVTRDFDTDGSLTREMVLRSAKQQGVDPETFAPPAGSRRQAILRPN